MGPRELAVIDVDDPPHPGPGEVQIRVTAVGVCGTDLHYYRGENAGYETLARGAGAQAVFATDLLDYRLRLAKSCGATETINCAKVDPVATIMAATGGRGVDVVFEVAGAPDTPEQAVQIAKPLGTIVIVGICAENRTTFTATSSRRKGLTIKISRRMKHIYRRTHA